MSASPKPAARQLWPWGAGVVLLLLAIVLVGCPSTPVEPPAPPVKPGDSTKLPPVKPYLEGWEQPAVALLLTGEQHGYLEPCGCSLSQSGGLSRRGDLLRILKERGWPVVGLDLGGTLKRARRQDQIKFETLLDSLKLLQYQVLGLGREELRLGAEYILSQHQPDERLPFVSANVVFFGSPDLGTPLASRIVTAGQLKIGVTSILGNGYKSELLPADAPADAPLTIVDPAEALPKALAELQAQKPDLLVLLSHAPVAESKALAEKFPAFDLVVSAGGPEDPLDKPQQIGKTWFLTPGHKGKYIVVAGVYPNTPEKFRFEAIDLDSRRFQPTEAMEQQMRAYQERLAGENVALDLTPVPHPTGAEYTGAEACGKCHTKAYSKWKNSKHALAFTSLSKGRKGQEATWISRTSDPECLACHVTGWNPQEVYPYTGGFRSEAESPHLVGQQCENCHGPGSQHAAAEQAFKKMRGKASEELKSLRAAMHLDPKQAKERVCYTCHDLDNSPTFEFDKYWKEVVHPWRD